MTVINLCKFINLICFQINYALISFRLHHQLFNYSNVAMQQCSNDIKSASIIIIILFEILQEANMNDNCSDISDSQQSFLRPISKFCPPNQIITKDYAPDEKPVLKLMKMQKPENLTCQQLKKQYATIFQSQDTLGFQYSHSLANNIIYLKLNNQNYLKLKMKNNTIKFLAGLFIPTQKILTPEVKNSKNIYRVLEDVQFSEYKIHIEDSFAKNCKNSTGQQLRFSSNYESGNLFIAMKKKQYEYNLILQNDLNSKGNTQWFNFVVEFFVEGTYAFNILNFTKSYSQYQDGMRIVYYSYKDQENGLNGWFRGCTNIQYEESTVCREDCSSKNYYSLKFQYTCTYPSDKVIFAYFYPYTTLDLQKFFKKTLYRRINVHMKMEKIKICETLSGLPVYVISIQHKKNYRFTDQNSPTHRTKSIQKVNKSVIYMARQHSGETQGSFVTQGIIQILMENGQIDYLKRHIDFYIFPMVNADGVLYGNYRTNLSGADLNRIWRNPKKDLHPEVYYIKKYLQNINKMSPISLIIDIHGHSKSLNSFFYGNPYKKDSAHGPQQDPRLFPYVCSKKIKAISFEQSTFSIKEDKKNSARVVLSQTFPKALVYTLENSFHGWRKDRNAIHQYTPEVLRKIGRDLVVTYLEYERVFQKNPQIKEKWTKQICQLKNKGCEDHQDIGDSDSEADFELIDIAPADEKKNQEKSIFDTSSSQINSILISNEKQRQNFIQRNLIIKNNANEHRYNKYQRNIPSLDNKISQGLKKEGKQNILIKPTHNQGFLSIVKIKTTGQIQAQIENNLAASLEEHKKTIELKFTKESVIEKLKRKKIKIQEAVNSSTGMRTFLRAMGIPLDRKYE